MHPFILFSLAAPALESAEAPHDVRPWNPPGPTDSRSPCPGLNTLANHGYLPRHGFNLTVPQFGDAVSAGFGWHREFGDNVANATFTGLGVTSIKLEDLNVHNASEHRASMTRNDDNTGDAMSFVPERLEALFRDSDTDFLDVKSMARSRIRLEAQSGLPLMPEFQRSAARGESSLLLMLMSVGGVPPAGNGTDLGLVRAPDERVRAWMTEERLPTEHGWKRSERVVRLVDFQAIADAILAEMKAIESG
ncbi:putative sterigmatocystin biosynthesis peroxidase stcC [Colletotrichum liriopes]|uniref:Sterigmatocystin biosynthesis peroxidase stcC n=1 Tax=Colletotrichum liriopes TaxID=708192 RepID=A0AA37LZH4_9PEZI|nr:putative sterigmatocystin biosynthesis peroxidase stcC [Colletotrichum liriopes]